MTELLAKTRRGVFYVLPTQVAIKIIGLVYVVLLARSLTVETYGIYNFVIGALMVFSYLCNFGVASSLQRFLPEYAKLERYALLLKSMLAAHAFRATLSILVLFLANITFTSWADTFNISEFRIEFVIFSLGAFILFQLEYLQTEFSSLFHHAISSFVQLVYSVLKLVGVIFVLYYGAGLLGVLIAEALAYLLAFIIAVYYFITRLYVPFKKQFDVRTAERLEYRRLGRYSGYNALVTPGGILYSHSADYFVIAAMASPLELGLYALASRASKMLTSIMPQNVLQSVLRPTIYYHCYSVDDQRAALHRIFRSLVVLIALFIVPVVALMLATAGPVIEHVFGSNYVAATSVFLVLVVFSIFTLLEFPSDMVLQVIEKVEIRAYAQIFAVYNLGAAILLLPGYGIMGVAVATGSALMFKCLFFFYMAKYYTRISLDWPALLKIAINSTVSGLTAYGVILYSDSVLFLVFALMAGGAVYLVLSYVNNPMNQYEKQLVNDFAKRRVFNV
jgi:O-antigen/teichoic acid export membrane protein